MNLAMNHKYLTKMGSQDTNLKLTVRKSGLNDDNIILLRNLDHSVKLRAEF